jgi:hypothetical protein
MECATRRKIKIGKRRQDRAKGFLRYGMISDQSPTSVAIVTILSCSQSSST